MIASLATVEGREKQCAIVERSLRSQCRTFIWKEEVDGRTDDARKFCVDWKLHNYSGYILTCDDDLEYPADYAEYMVKKSEQYGCPVSLMGRVVTGASKSYYRDKGATRKIDWRDSTAPDERVHIPGSGVFCYHTDHVRFDISDLPYENMSDIHVGVKLNRLGIPIMRVAPPKREWIKYLEVPNTIYDKHRNDDRVQTALMNQQEWASF